MPKLPDEPQSLAIYVMHEPRLRALADKLDRWPRVNSDATYDERIAHLPSDLASAGTCKRLQQQLAQANVAVVLISEDARSDAWIHWEIESIRAATRRIGLVGVLLQPWHIRPAAMTDCGAIFVPFKRDMVERAILWATTERHDRDDFQLVDE